MFHVFDVPLQLMQRRSWLLHQRQPDEAIIVGERPNVDALHVLVEHIEVSACSALESRDDHGSRTVLAAIRSRPSSPLV